MKIDHILKFVLNSVWIFLLTTPEISVAKENTPKVTEVERLNMAKRMLEEFNSDFREFALDNGYSVSLANPSPAVAKTPEGSFNIYERGITLSRKSNLTVKDSTCGPLEKVVQCRTGVDMYFVDLQSAPLNQKPTLSTDSLGNDNYYETNYLTHSEKSPYRFVKTSPQIFCDSLQFLPPGKTIVVASWSIDNRVTNVQTGQQDQVRLTELPGFRGEVSPQDNSIKLDFFKGQDDGQFITNRKMYINSFDNSAPYFKWIVVNPATGSSCKIDWVYNSEKISEDVLYNGEAKLFYTHPLSDFKMSSSYQGTGLGSYVTKHIQSCTLPSASRHGDFINILTSQTGEPIFEFLEKVGAIVRFQSDTASVSSGDGNGSIFQWSSKIYPDCKISMTIKWPKL